MAIPKTALVTGTSKGGIGDAIAQELHKRGFRVFATARNLTKVQHLANLGLDVVQLDVVDSASIDAAVAHVQEATGGKLDMLVNNSGVSKSTKCTIHVVTSLNSGQAITPQSWIRRLQRQEPCLM